MASGKTEISLIRHSLHLCCGKFKPALSKTLKFGGIRQVAKKGIDIQRS